MKKINAFIAVFSLLAVSTVRAGGPEFIVLPDYFTGFYVGGTISVHNLVSNQNSSFDPVEDITVANVVLPIQPIYSLMAILPASILSTNEADTGTIDIYGGIQGGLGKVFNHRWYLGIEGFGEWGKQQTTTTNTTTTPAQLSVTVSQGDTTFSQAIVSNTTSITTTTSTKIKNDYGVAGKIGYLFTPTTLLYGKIGAVWADITVSSSMSGTNNASFLNSVFPMSDISSMNQLIFTASNSNSDTKTALLLGIGMEQFVYADRVSLSLEYNYADFGSVKTSGNVFVQSTTISSVVDDIDIPVNTQSMSQTLEDALSASADAKISTFLVGLNFYFGRNWL